MTISEEDLKGFDELILEYETKLDKVKGGVHEDCWGHEEICCVAFRVAIFTKPLIAEVRRLREENLDVRKSSNAQVLHTLESYIKDNAALIELGKAVEAMQEFWMLEKMPGPKWHVYDGFINCENDTQMSESCVTPLEALQKAKGE